MAPLLACLLFASLPEVAAQQAERLAKLDKLALRVEHSVYICPAAADPLDSANWQVPWERNTFPSELTVVRPYALMHFLTDDPDLGYAPVTASIADNHYTQVQDRLDDQGDAVYTVVPGRVGAGVFAWSPILQAFDLHMMDSGTPYLNVAALLGREDVRLVRSSPECDTYGVSVPDDGYRHEFEIDLDPCGTPTRVHDRLILDRAGVRPIERTQYVRATREIDGAALPVDVCVVHVNPNVVDYSTVDHLVVTGIDSNPDLTLDSVRIDPPHRSARITIEQNDGQFVRLRYDAAGALVESKITGGPEPISPESATLVSRSSLRWRWIVPGAAGAVGLAAMAILAFTSRRGIRTA